MLIANKYEIIEKINEGEFGIIVKGKNIRSGEYVAIKIEKNNLISTLKMEAKIYQYLKNLDGFPKLKWYGKIENLNYLVLDLLVYNLSDLIKEYGKLSLIKTLEIGIQLFSRIEVLHNKLLIHRDIKPNNIMIKKDKVYLIDFGMCKCYQHNRKHIECKKLTKIIGTPNFVSLNIHNGNEPSRRDDIESIVYILIYLLFGNLKWDKEERIENIMSLKVELTNDKNIPLFIKLLLFYVRQLKFEEKPNYKYLVNILEKELNEK
jgi:serine/threonine protein kinase